MAFTDRTDNVRLPQWTDDDKPTWLGDLNTAFKLIDAEFGRQEAQRAVLQAQVNALQAQVNSLNGG